MSSFRTKRRAEISQPFLANLSNAPLLRIAALVRVVDVRKRFPIVAASVGDRSAQCIAMTTNVLGQTVDDQIRT